MFASIWLVAHISRCLFQLNKIYGSRVASRREKLNCEGLTRSCLGSECGQERQFQMERHCGATKPRAGAIKTIPIW